MLEEFKKFALKGNMVDMAVGIVIGAAFGTIVSSLVDDIITPVISGIFKIPDFTNLFINLSGGESFSSLKVAREAGASVLAYGNFINALLAFLLIVLALFFVVKGINHLRKKKEEAPSGPTEVDLLKEIRDLLQR